MGAIAGQWRALPIIGNEGIVGDMMAMMGNGRDEGMVGNGRDEGMVGGHAGPPLRALKCIDTDSLIMRRLPAHRGVYLEHNIEHR
jgi:hypothetical protein